MQLSFPVMIAILLVKAITGFKGFFISKDVEVLTQVDLKDNSTDNLKEDFRSNSKTVSKPLASTNYESKQNTEEKFSKSGYSRLAHNIDGVDDSNSDFISLEDLTKDIIKK